MKDKKPVAIKCHVGVFQLNGDMTIEVKKHKCRMEIVPVGVLVVTDRVQLLIPFTNITQIEVVDAAK